MIVALPLTSSLEFSPHFGAAAKAGFMELDLTSQRILRSWSSEAPEAEPCSWAPWLAAMGVSTFFTGGMGKGAQQRMQENGITVILGVPALPPEVLVGAWLAGTLTQGSNACEGGHGHHEHKHDHEQGHDCGCSCSH